MAKTNDSHADAEIAVIGGGLVGMAVAYGLQRLGRQVAVFDQGDVALRASRGNFGLVWVQGKGANLPDYARWTRHSAALWPELATELEVEGGIRVEHAQPGGFHLALSDDELETRVAMLQGMRDALEGDYPFEVLGHNALRSYIPEIGPDVVGAVYGPEDGHANPLYLLRGLYSAFRAKGGRVVNGSDVRAVHAEVGAFRVEAAQTMRAGKVVLAAGHGNAALAPALGLEAPIRPQRGQVIVTERMQPFLNFPTLNVRQVGEGAIQIGDSKEDVGFDDGTTPNVLAKIAARAVRSFPMLEAVRMVRSWAAVRILSPDGCPIYDQSQDVPGAFLVNCHSGVTLAAAHALSLAKWIDGGPKPENVESLSAQRFQLHAAA